MKNVLLISNLYPNAQDLTRGLFIQQLAERFNKQVNLSVVAPLPWRPSLYYRLVGKKKVEAKEIVNGIDVHHPTHLVIPKIGRFLYGILFFFGIYSLVRSLVKERNIDVISAHWAYPDGVASVLIGKLLGIPVVVHALGCDINEFTKYRLRRWQIVWALKSADSVVVKSSALKDKIVELGIDEDKVNVCLNGVDKEKFTPIAKQEARKALGLPEQEDILLFIGNFQVEKGIEYLLRAFSELKPYGANMRLLVIGGGALEGKIKLEIETLGIEENVSLIGKVEHGKIPQYLNAADLLCLPSLREGCPNVVIEALSCDTMVAASKVGAVPDLITNAAWGGYVAAEDVSALASLIRLCLRKKEEEFPAFDWISWEENASAVLDVLSSVVLRVK